MLHELHLLEMAFFSMKMPLACVKASEWKTKPVQTFLPSSSPPRTSCHTGAARMYQHLLSVSHAHLKWMWAQGPWCSQQESTRLQNLSAHFGVFSITGMLEPFRPEAA